MKYLKCSLVLLMIFTSLIIFSACGTPTTGKAVGDVSSKQINNIINWVDKLETISQEDLIIEQISPIIKNNNQNVITNNVETNNNYVLTANGKKVASKKAYLPQKISETINYKNKNSIKNINTQNNITEVKPNENKVKNFNYAPRYINNTSKNFTTDNLQKYLAQIEDLYTYASDCISANAEYEQTKECLKNCCEDYLDCAKKLQEGKTKLTTTQIDNCNKCINKINQSFDKLKQNKGEINKLIKKIKPLIKDYTKNINALYENYGQLNQKFDTKIMVMNECCDNITNLCNIVCGKQSQTQANLTKRKINTNNTNNTNTRLVDTKTKQNTYTFSNNATKNNNTKQTQTKNDAIRSQRINNNNTTMQKAKNQVNSSKNTTMQNTKTNKNLVQNRNSSNVVKNYNKTQSNNAKHNQIINNKNNNIANNYNKNNVVNNNQPVINNSTKQMQNAIMNNSGSPIVNSQNGMNNYSYPYNVNYYGRNIDTYQNLPKNIDTYQNINTNIDTYGKNYVPRQNQQENQIADQIIPSEQDANKQNNNVVATPIEDNKTFENTTNNSNQNDKTLENSVVDTVHRSTNNAVVDNQVTTNTTSPLPNPFDPQKVEKIEQNKKVENVENNIPNTLEDSNNQIANNN